MVTEANLDLVAAVAALIVAMLVALAEAIHVRRVKHVAHLAFGPSGRPALWARLAPVYRIVAAAALAWGLVMLWFLPPRIHKSLGNVAAKPRHVVLVLDVSPSMKLKDAGPDGDQSRRQRAATLLRSFFDRVSVEQFRITIVAVYNGAMPVVIDTRDVEVIQNILNDLPMDFAFRAGETKLLSGLEEAAQIARTWDPRSTTVVVISDGDTVPATGMPKMPASVSDVLVVGVGDPVTGKFINGKQSRQDSTTLRQIAARLQGHYHEGNQKHIPTATLKLITGAYGESKFESLTRREYALIALAIGSAIYAILPWLLVVAGRPARGRLLRRRPAASQSPEPSTTPTHTSA